MAFRKKLFCLISSLFIISFASGFPSLSADDFAALKGSWKSESAMGTFVLVFQSPNVLVFGGETAGYSLIPGAIRVQDEYGYVDYYYQLKGDTLAISFPEGYQLTFQRVGKRTGRKTTAPKKIKKSGDSTDSGSSFQGSKAKTASSSSVGGGEIGDPNWGFKFRQPKGWKYQKGYKGVIMGHDRIAGLIIVEPHLAESQQEVQKDLLAGYQEESTYFSLAGGLESLGNGAMAGTYNGVFEGQTAKARGIGTYSPYGGGAYITALTTPDKFGDEIVKAADSIAMSMIYFKIDISGLASHFSGTWVHTTPSTQTWMTLEPNMTFSTNYEAGYMGTFSDQFGNQVGNWGHAVNDKDGGRWTIRGNKREGLLILKYPNGAETYMEYHVHVERGREYWTEYVFDKKLYAKR